MMFIKVNLYFFKLLKIDLLKDSHEMNDECSFCQRMCLEGFKVILSLILVIKDIIMI